MIQLAPRPSIPVSQPPISFRMWRQSVAEMGILPVIGVAGSRGKTTVVRLLDTIMREAGLRTITWTDSGVEIEGRHQRGELGPWSHTLPGLRSGEIDVAIQELDWATVSAVGLPTGSYPLVAVTNICVNNDECLIQEDTRRALRAMDAVLAAAHFDGLLILNGEDFAVAGTEAGYPATTILVGLNRLHPLLRPHLEAGGTAAWLEDQHLVYGQSPDPLRLVDITELDFALAGAARFELANALIASSLAINCGIPIQVIARALRDFKVPLDSMPGSFNVTTIGGASVVIDRPTPSWFLRPALRAIAHTVHARTLTVVGRLDEVPTADLADVGRLLGRTGGVVVLHSSEHDPARAEQLREGIAANKVPPLLMHLPTERIAVNRALKMIRPGDLLFILADNPAAVGRAVARAVRAVRTEPIDV